jgi:hypothetical protein
MAMPQLGRAVMAVSRFGSVTAPELNRKQIATPFILSGNSITRSISNFSELPRQIPPRVLDWHIICSRMKRQWEG